MQFTSETPRKEITIKGVVLSVPQPFTEGHVCTAAEAQALNQLLAENSRNNFSGRVEKAAANGGADPAALQPELDEYLASYEFGVRTGGGGGRAPVDPVEKEALRLAEEAVRKSIAKKGLKAKDVGNEKIKALAAEAITTHPQFRQEAERRVKAAAKIGLDELQLG